MKPPTSAAAAPRPSYPPAIILLLLLLVMMVAGGEASAGGHSRRGRYSHHHNIHEEQQLQQQYVRAPRTRREQGWCGRWLVWVWLVDYDRCGGVDEGGEWCGCGWFTVTGVGGGQVWEVDEKVGEGVAG
ncbi:hypothetical protein Pcinc_023570 [Petrolisthes cinctipes]|uniref:Uncharacterized protein n=1 Tax=Petrolisthes cinctipes TaxID=88211 RepID=A0AAE1FCX3_PETCI|nr:hypothetical protein Pcinc_023570 [Petrolisthes cinctipes]